MVAALNGAPSLQHIQTPLIYSSILSNSSGYAVYLKLENTQPCGSFKLRGVGTLALSILRKHGPTARLVTSSGGNAGLACAHAAKAYGMACTVYVPTSVKKIVVGRLEGMGARVVVGGADWYEADKALRMYVSEDPESRFYVPPFDHDELVAGNSTIVREMDEQLKAQGVGEVGAYICTVGGGGLLSGILTGLQTSSHSAPVLACETKGAASLALSLRSSFSTDPPVVRLESLDKIETVATSLGARQVSATCLGLAVKHPQGVMSVVMDDSRAVYAVRRFANDHGFLAEPACTATLVPIYLPSVLHTAGISSGAVVVVIVCGGNTFDLDALEQWEGKFGRKEGGDIVLFSGARGELVVE